MSVLVVVAIVVVGCAFLVVLAVFLGLAMKAPEMPSPPPGQRVHTLPIRLPSDPGDSYYNGFAGLSYGQPQWARALCALRTGVAMTTDLQDAAVRQVRAHVATVEAERDEARQALWDVYRTLGFDTDGDATPHAHIDVEGVVRRAAIEFRQDYDHLVHQGDDQS
jgi:hypothetical protein